MGLTTDKLACYEIETEVSLRESERLRQMDSDFSLSDQKGRELNFLPQMSTHTQSVMGC